MTKQVLRQRLLQKLRVQPEPLRLAKSIKVARALRRSALYRKARSLLCYVAADGEVETRPLLAQALLDGKRVAVPVIVKRHKKLIAAEIRDVEKDLNFQGPFGIPEPKVSARRRVGAGTLDLILVPGVAFDRQGRRLGRGGGYFDRFLSEVPAAIPRVGLAFHFQLLKKIPWEIHDQPVRRIITEKSIVDSSRGGR